MCGIFAFLTKNFQIRSASQRKLLEEVLDFAFMEGQKRGPEASTQVTSTDFMGIQTIEDKYRYNMHEHSFVGFDQNTPLMAPVALMSRKFLDELGGLDRRFVCGQYENDIIMRLYEANGSVIIKPSIT